jgi:hypothetical protein
MVDNDIYLYYLLSTISNLVSAQQLLSELTLCHFKFQHFTISLTVHHYLSSQCLGFRLLMRASLVFACLAVTEKNFLGSALQAHLRTRSGEKRYRCCQCSKLFTTSSVLQAQLRTHQGRNHTVGHGVQSCLLRHLGCKHT